MSEKTELIKWQLTELSCADPENIESNDYEIMGEDEAGRDGYCTVQITKVAEDALYSIINLEQEVLALKAMVNELRDLFAVRFWTLDKANAWHSNIPNTIEAFEALLGTAKTSQQSLDALNAEIEEEVIERCIEFLDDGACEHSGALHNLKRKHQLPTNEDQIDNKSKNE